MIHSEIDHFASKYSELFIVFRDQRIHTVYIQEEWGLSRAGERRGKKVPHPHPAPLLPPFTCAHTTLTTQLSNSRADRPFSYQHAST
jgi:hypothetical protein